MIYTDGTPTIANAPHRGQGTPLADQPYSAKYKPIPTDLRIAESKAQQRVAELEHELASLRRTLERQL